MKVEIKLDPSTTTCNKVNSGLAFIADMSRQHDLRKIEREAEKTRMKWDLCHAQMLDSLQLVHSTIKYAFTRPTGF